MNIFFTSDLHFGHKSVLTKFDYRPFKNVKEMNEELIRRWNRKVSRKDIVYVLGDMFWDRNPHFIETTLKRLNGNIILVKGNHDGWIRENKNFRLLSGIKDYCEIDVKLKNGTIRRCVLSHYFMPLYNGHARNSIHLHGHSHNNFECEVEREIAKALRNQGHPNQIYNVGCMHWNYEPVTLDEILENECI